MVIDGSLYPTGPVKKNWKSVINDKTKINLTINKTVNRHVKVPNLAADAAVDKGNLIRPKLVSEAGKIGVTSATSLPKDIISEGEDA